MPCDTPIKINPVLRDFALSESTAVPAEVIVALCGKTIDPKLASFLGNADKVRGYLRTQFFREGWSRLSRFGKFKTVWEQEIVENRALDAEANYARVMPGLDDARRKEVVAETLSYKDSHVKPIGYFGRFRDRPHARYSPRRECKVEELVTT